MNNIEAELSIRNKLIELGWTPPKEEKKWNPRVGCWTIDSLGEVKKRNIESFPAALAGVDRDTKEACELAAKRRLYNERLSALAHELGGERCFIRGCKNYYIYMDFSSSQSVVFDNTFEDYIYNPETVYMTRECASQICDMINSGEVEL